MRKFQVVIEVDEKHIWSVVKEMCKAADSPLPDTIEQCITAEMEWIGQSGIYLVEIQNEIV